MEDSVGGEFDDGFVDDLEEVGEFVVLFHCYGLLLLENGVCVGFFSLGWRGEWWDWDGEEEWGECRMGMGMGCGQQSG